MIIYRFNFVKALIEIHKAHNLERGEITSSQWVRFIQQTSLEINKHRNFLSKNSTLISTKAGKCFIGHRFKGERDIIS